MTDLNVNIDDVMKGVLDALKQHIRDMCLGERRYGAILTDDDVIFFVCEDEPSSSLWEGLWE